MNGGMSMSGKPNQYTCKNCGASLKYRQSRCEYCDSFVVWGDDSDYGDYEEFIDVTTLEDTRTRYIPRFSRDETMDYVTYTDW